MWPLIIAEGLVLVRKAITIYTVISTAKDILAGDDDEEQDKKLRTLSTDDEDVYYYFLVKGLFQFVEKTSSYKIPADDEIIKLVDTVLVSDIYCKAHFHSDVKTNAFCTSFARILMRDHSNITSSIKTAIEYIYRTREVPWLVEHACADKTFVRVIKKRLKLLSYKEESIDATIKAFAEGAYRTTHLKNYLKYLEDQPLGIPDSWLSRIYSVLINEAGKNITYMGGRREGAFFFNTAGLPSFERDEFSDFREIKYVSPSVTRWDTNQAEDMELISRGMKYDSKSKSWYPEIVPTNMVNVETTEEKDESGKMVKRIVKKTAEKVAIHVVSETIKKSRLTDRLISIGAKLITKI